MQARWFNSWGPELDRALENLPALSGLSHDDYRALAQNVGPTAKRHAIVSSKGEVCSVVSLRKRQHYFEPVTSLCMPTVVVPTNGEPLLSVLRATGIEVRVPEFFGPPSTFPASATLPFDIYSVDLQSEYERHWKENGYWKAMRNIRNRTAHLDVRADEPSDLDWVLDQWVVNWQTDPLNMGSAAPDMRMLWKRLREQGRIQTVAIAEGDEVLAAVVSLIENGSLLGLCTARVPDRPTYSLGTKLLDATFEVGRSAGYHAYDLGGWSDYKHRLAPMTGERYSITLRPPLQQALHRSRDVAAGVKRRLVRLVSRVTPGDAARQ